MVNEIIDREGDDLHRPIALPLLEPIAREIGHVDFDRLVQPIDGVVHPRDLGRQLAIVVQKRGHHVAQHGFDGVAHADRLAGGVGERKRRRVERGFIQIPRHSGVGWLFFLRQNAHQE